MVIEQGVESSMTNDEQMRSSELRSGPDRREFLAASGLALGLAATPLHAARSERKTRRVILIAFAGGVRSRETFGSPENVPSLMALAKDGVLYTRTRTANLGHYGAALSLFTGISEARGIRDNTRGPDPTLFEYLRKDRGLSAGEVWISTSGGAQQTNYSHGLHAEYGARYGANTLDGEGIFNHEFRDLLGRYGRPRMLESDEQAVLEGLRDALDGGLDAAQAENARTVERYVLDELTKGTSDLRGAGSSDAKALRVARNLISIFKPTLTAVVLQDADIAHGSYNGYVEVIRRNDASIGEIHRAVLADPALRDSTAIVVLPEFGRDRDLNARRGLDHGDNSDELNFVSTVCWGPDFRSGQVVTKDVRAIDVCPTLCELLGADARLARGGRLPKLFA